uniref:non-specific protein-tyrosine kinase n=1 Tax=Callorhinchus milii TaxID=7868 RepID=V9KP20_CALMI
MGSCVGRGDSWLGCCVGRGGRWLGCCDVLLCAIGKWEIAPTDLTFLEELGSGQFGVVQLGYWQNQCCVAIKTIREGAMSEEDFIEEAQVMMKLSHPKLVQLFGVCTQTSPICLVFEHLEHGSLSEYLGQNRGTFNTGSLLGMCQDTCQGMEYLERNQFLHRDLAARNCLVGESLVVKVSDFGMTRFVLDDQYTSSSGTKFPVRWSAPEVFRYFKFSSKSDVWSFGVLMWEIFTLGGSPYPGIPVEELFKLLKEGHRMDKPANCTNDLYMMMRDCWHAIPAQRPTFKQLVEDLDRILTLSSNEEYLDLSAPLEQYSPSYPDTRSSCSSGDDSVFTDPMPNEPCLPKYQQHMNGTVKT